MKTNRHKIRDFLFGEDIESITNPMDTMLNSMCQTECQFRDNALKEFCAVNGVKLNDLLERKGNMRILIEKSNSTGIEEIHLVEIKNTKRIKVSHELKIGDRYINL